MDCGVQIHSSPYSLQVLGQSCYFSFAGRLWRLISFSLSAAKVPRVPRHQCCEAYVILLLVYVLLVVTVRISLYLGCCRIISTSSFFWRARYFVFIPWDSQAKIYNQDAKVRWGQWKHLLKDFLSAAGRLHSKTAVSSLHLYFNSTPLFVLIVSSLVTVSDVVVN